MEYGLRHLKQNRRDAAALSLVIGGHLTYHLG
jgi:hypothetical protein